MFTEETVERLLLAHHELAGLDAGVVHTQNGVDVVERLCAHVCELLNLRGHVLDLVVREREVELFDTRLDGVPAGQTVPIEEKRVNETMDLAMKIEYCAYPIET